MFLALNEILMNKKKFALIIMVILLISYLVLFLFALAYGLSKDRITAIELLDADYIVLKEGSNTNILRSGIEYKYLEEIKNENMSALTVMRTSGYINEIETEDHLVDIVIMGMKYDSDIFPKIIKGRMPKDRYEVVISKDLEKENDVKINDIIKLSQSYMRLKVVGITEESKFSTAPTIYGELFMAYGATAMVDPFEGVETSSFPTPNTPINALVIKGSNPIYVHPKVEVIPMDKFIREIPGYFAELLTFTIMIGFLIVISSVVLGVFLYIITLQKKTTFGIMKIQGIKDKYIERSVMVQTIILSVSGVFLGLILTYLTGFILPPFVPFRTDLLYFLGVCVLMIMTSLIGAVFSVKSVSKIDPLEVLE